MPKSLPTEIVHCTNCTGWIQMGPTLVYWISFNANLIQQLMTLGVTVDHDEVGSDS